jgi:hypothetical protein
MEIQEPRSLLLPRPAKSRASVTGLRPGFLNFRINELGGASP